MPFPYDPWCNTCGEDISMATWNKNDGECFKCLHWWKKQDLNESDYMAELTTKEIVYEISDLMTFLIQEPDEINAKNIVFLYKLVDELRDVFLDGLDNKPVKNTDKNRIDVI